MKYTDEQKEQARTLFWQGSTIPEIAAALHIEKRSIYNWSKAGRWNAARPDDPELLVRQRLAILLNREWKTVMELEEQNQIMRHIETMARIRTRQERGASDSGTDSGKRGGKSGKNDFTKIDETDLMEKFFNGLFGYQLECWEHRNEKLRDILKSRQIGMTWYFAREAFTDALLTGRNKLFISASRKQAEMFRSYICKFAREWFGIELRGRDCIKLQTRHGIAELHFLSTNSKTAQSYHGDLYIDEYFWIPKFDILKDVAMGMASQKKWHITFFSTPSSKGSPAYKFWSGDEYNERMRNANKPLVIFPEPRELRKHGICCADMHWRRIITITDAEREGCRLFNLEELKTMFSEDRFNMLFMCKFIDDAQSCFRFDELQKCLSNAEKWQWFHPDQPRPYAGPVWIGYDPSRTRDGACIVVLSAPESFRGKFYVLEKISLKNAAWEYQAGVIRDLCGKYNVAHIGIDITGPGSGVFEQVQRFYPAAEKINYTLDIKAKLVLKAQQVIAAERIEWDSCYSDIAAGFLLIHRTTTQNANITYVADRSDLTGHADAAWAIMHALIHEDLIQPDEENSVLYTL